jgi:uncharacterized metal-binding protein
MPSGATHDRITLISLPIVSGLTLLISRSASITLSLAGGFLFSGLMFGPDLDIYSLQFKRWGMLRWIWRPYQKSMRHRSWFSHGPIIGTLVRLVYLGCWVALGGIIYNGVAILNHWTIWSWDSIQQQVRVFAQQYYGQGLAILAGLELGALSHSWSDAISSAWKKWHRPRRKHRP